MTIQLTLAEKKQILDHSYSTAIACIITGEVSSYEFTANPATEELNITGHNFVSGVPVRVSNSGGGLPDGLDSNTTYYVINPTANKIKLSTTVGGTAININSVGSGTHTLTEQPLIETVKTHEFGLLPIWVRHEADLPRQTVNWGTPTINITRQTVTITPSEVVFAPVSPVAYRYLILIRDGNLISGNSQGEIMAVIDNGTATIGIDGLIFNLGAIAL